MKLTSEPAGDVVVTVSGQAGSGVTLSGTGLSNDDELTFTSVDWATAQTVTVAATDDDVAEANETVTLAHAVASTDDAAYNALSDVNVSVTVTDNDSVGVSIDPTSLTVVEGSSVDYAVKLGFGAGGGCGGHCQRPGGQRCDVVGDRSQQRRRVDVHLRGLGHCADGDGGRDRRRCRGGE